ncbi:Vacuolar sorting protein VPS45 [Phaffia rhodozyma]|uniref:Vacuolar sorting protein VPS45 n=1 Tax=Phaffia rhodozyma TaxID=264483 RepID=A0A0F7SJV5_PHARH|nr:Vacuolar sorting protein VPS45 [Phaffia rhodozyma]
MDISRTSTPALSESIFSAEDSTQFDGDFSSSIRARLERAGSLSSTPIDLSQLNLVSLNGSLSRPGSDLTARQGFHAISTVLSHPTRKPAPLRASRIPLPPAPPPEVLPRVNKNDLNTYIQSISAEWGKYEQSARNSDKSSTDAYVGDVGRKNQSVEAERHLPALNSIPDVYFRTDFNLGNPHIFDQVTGRLVSPPPVIDSSSFDSPLPTLKPLSERTPSSNSLVSADPDPSIAKVTSHFPTNFTADPPTPIPTEVFQEKLSGYLDVVEQHLIAEISKRSASFFAALTNLQDLQSESETCLSRIESLRLELDMVDKAQAQRGLEAVKLARSLKQLKSVESAVSEIKGIEEALGMIKGLVSTGDGHGAVELWEEVDSWVKNKGKGKQSEQMLGTLGSGNRTQTSSSPSTPGRPRKGSSGRFRSGSLLKQVEEEPDGGLSEIPTSTSHFIPSSPSRAEPRSPPRSPSLPSFPRASSSSKRNIHQHRTPPSPIDLTGLSSLAGLPQSLAGLALAIGTQLESELHALLEAEMVGKLQDLEAVTAKLRPLVLGLVRVRENVRLVTVFREVAVSQIRSVAKQYIPQHQDEPVDEDASQTKISGSSSTLSPLSKLLKEMPHSKFLAMEKVMSSGLLESIQKIERFSQAIGDIMEATNSSVADPSSSLSGQSLTIKTELSDVLSQAAELANSRASKIMGVRNEQHASLELDNFIETFDEAWNFVLSCEVICRKMIVGLRGTMVVQAKMFLQNYHSQRLSKSAKMVENELWSPEEVSPAQQRAVEIIVASAVSDPPELILKNRIGSDVAPSATVTEGQTVKHLQIEDRTFILVGATLGSIELLVDYLKLIVNIELITTDVMSKVTEYLKSFNSRTCQVVLGAGAMRSAGLKNITAKHLALASQSLSVMVALIPYIRETIRRHLSAKQAVMLIEFDKLKRDFQEHQYEIHAKLVAIMGDRLAIHIKTFREIDWEVASKRPSSPNEYAELLVKETSQLHKILSRYLPDQTVESVLSQVFASINHELSSAYADVILKSDEAKSRMLQDANYLVAKLSALNKVNPILPILPNLVKDKSVPRRPVGASMKNLMRRVSSNRNGPASADEASAQDDESKDKDNENENENDDEDSPLGGEDKIRKDLDTRILGRDLVRSDSVSNILGTPSPAVTPLPKEQLLVDSTPEGVLAPVITEGNQPDKVSLESGDGSNSGEISTLAGEPSSLPDPPTESTTKENETTATDIVSPVSSLSSQTELTQVVDPDSEIGTEESSANRELSEVISPEVPAETSEEAQTLSDIPPSESLNSHLTSPIEEPSSSLKEDNQVGEKEPKI